MGLLPESHPRALHPHLVFSLVKRWVMGTLHGSISPEHMPAYFDEWVFRFNRRHSHSRGLLFQRLLQQAIEGDVITYKELPKVGRTRPPRRHPQSVSSSDHPASNARSPGCLGATSEPEPSPGLRHRDGVDDHLNPGYESRQNRRQSGSWALSSKFQMDGQ